MQLNYSHFDIRCNQLRLQASKINDLSEELPVPFGKMKISVSALDVILTPKSISWNLFCHILLFLKSLTVYIFKLSLTA